MPFKRSPRTEALRDFILEHVADHPAKIVQIAARRFGVSRQAVLAHHVNKLIEQGLLTASGTTSARTYHLRRRR